LAAFLSVLMIDLVLAGDNAVAVGLAAGGLPPKDREQAVRDEEDAQAVLDDDPATEPRARPVKSFRQAFLQVLIADVSMSLDNVLAVAGAARQHPAVLIFGLLLSILLMGLAASASANLLHRFRWIGFVGLAIVLYVAGHIIWEGHRSVVIDLHKTSQYNAMAPSALEITPREVASHRRP
jgi:predicted tellurium resistance membrane protein TerC